MAKRYVRYHWTLEQRLAHYSGPKGPNGCIMWTGALSGAGYGQLSWKNKREHVHRLAYMAAHGPVPVGLEVCHHCDNPRCINPDHLWLDTHAANMADMAIKGRQKTKLTSAQVLAIRSDARPARRIAVDYGVAASLVDRIRARTAWQHI